MWILDVLFVYLVRKEESFKYTKPIMEETGLELPTPNVVADIAENSTIVEEGPRICPLCNSIVRTFFINYNEKIYMCENTECEFPFGSEGIESFKVDYDLASDVEVASIRSKPSYASQGSGSLVSAAEWSDIDRINRAYDAEDNYVPNAFVRQSNRHRMETRAKRQENEDKISQNVEEIKQLNKVLYDQGEEVHCIRNEKWIKNLFSLQSSSGMRLLKEQEMQKLKKDNDIGMGELKIDIDPGNDSISSIKIQINNRDKT